MILLFSGILLNHSEDLGLDSIPVSYELLELVYGVQPDEKMLGYSAGGHFIRRQGNSLLVDSTSFAECRQPLNGAVAQGAFIIALCSNSLFLVTLEGQLVERLGESHGLPQPLLQIGTDSDADSVLLRGENGIWKLNLTSLASSNMTGSIDRVIWSEATAYPLDLLKEITADLIVDDINLERLILDIHSGRILGTFGVFLADCVALLMAGLALSGFLMWLKKR